MSSYPLPLADGRSLLQAVAEEVGAQRGTAVHFPERVREREKEGESATERERE